ncbi:MAG: S49 family peptidase, partial [Methanosarcinaceae archaeon]|nr:S49 family peptidase [Methanosarcinaceae archaeon]
MHPNDKPSCFTSYMGHWLMEPRLLSHCVASVKAGILDGGVAPDSSSYELVVEDGLAIIAMNGPMMKGNSKFGGVSTVFTRQLVREAVSRADVKQILLVVESGGGSVSGTKELADDIKKANETKKVTAYINDIGASAAYWAASQASIIYANQMAEVGSIGVVAVVEDTSGMYEREGVKVHVISTGSMKGAFADGAPITEEMLSDLQEKVDQINIVFKGAILEGRGMDSEKLDAIADGRTYTASKSLELGLIDGIKPLEEVVANSKTQIIIDNRNESLTARL